MGDVKKWSVTYTKHVKQKRKVYQDGFLHLLSNKVMLYDESEQLLDSKFLTKDEAVKPGDSLAFASFLVDVGDPHNTCNPISNPSSKSECDHTPHERTRASRGDRKHNTAGRKTSSISLSPSQKIIREFKKNEALKYGAQSPRSPATSSFKEWEALYTTQITQKAKKYHDGFIRMIICGSQGRQVILYDISKNQLDKRFLKKDEIISSGESLTFDAHLVDVGDPMKTNEDDADAKIQDNPVSHAKRSKESALLDHHDSGNSVVKEQSRDNVCSSKCDKSNAGSFEINKIKQRKIVASRMSLRDANQILSILRKPETQDIATVGDAPVEQCLSGSPELVQLHDDVQAVNASLLVDLGQVITEVEKHGNAKTVNGGQSITCSDGIGPQCGATRVDSAAPPVDANCHCNAERLVSTPVIEIRRSSALKSHHNSQSTIDSSVDHGGSVVLQSSKGAGIIGSGSSVSSEATSQHQPSVKLTETKSKVKDKTTSTSHISEPKRLGHHLAAMKTKNCVETKKLGITSDCPSFDLGL